MDSIIETLKKNEKPFGLMSEEMQAKLKSINYADILCLQSEPQVVWTGCGPNLDFSDRNNFTNTFRLNEDYTEPEAGVETGVKKCKVVKTDGHLHFWDGDQRHALHQAPDEVNFIGYLYEDGYVCTENRRYLDGRGITSVLGMLDELKAGELKVLTPTHVLFRKQ